MINAVKSLNCDTFTMKPSTSPKVGKLIATFHLPKTLGRECGDPESPSPKGVPLRADSPPFTPKDK